MEEQDREVEVQDINVQCSAVVVCGACGETGNLHQGELLLSGLRWSCPMHFPAKRRARPSARSRMQ